MSNDNSIPGYRSLFDEEKSGFMEDLKDFSDEWIFKELKRKKKILFDKGPYVHILINRAYMDALVTIMDNRLLNYKPIEPDRIAVCGRRHPSRKTLCTLDDGHTGRHLAGEPFPDFWSDDGKVQSASLEHRGISKWDSLSSD